MSAQRDRLCVFISSKMDELTDLRAIVQKELEKLQLAQFVYERVQRANPRSPEDVSLAAVARADVFVLIIGKSYGRVTELEYDRARELGKPCFIYERLGRDSNDSELARFLEKLSEARNVP